MYAIKAKYDGIILKPEQPVHLEEEYEVIITFIEPVKKNSVRPKFQYDSMSGKIWMSDDFDAPLDDFKEYME